MLKEEYYATKKGGTFFNRKQLKIRNVKNFPGCQYVAGSTSFLSDKSAKARKELFASTFILPAAIEVARRIIRSLVPVSAGHSGHYVWDTAATDLLVREAGGKSATWQGKPVKHDKLKPDQGICYATPNAYKEFIKFVKKYAAK